jgi:hypothetical protein
VAAVVAQSARLCLRALRCLQCTQLALCLLALALAVLLEPASRMQVLRLAIQAAKAETLRSAQSLPRTVAVAVAVAQALLRLVPEGLAAVSGQRVLRPVLRERTARAVAEMALPSQAAPRLAVLVVALGQTLLQRHSLLYTRATVALEAEAEAALMRRTLQQAQPELGAPGLWKPPAHLEVMGATRDNLGLQVLRPLQAACSVRVAEVEAVGMGVLAVQAVQAVKAQVAVAARVAAAHTQQVLAGLVGVVGLWYWSFDHAAICSC